MTETDPLLSPEAFRDPPVVALAAGRSAMLGPAVRERALGAVVGAAVGDALGAGFEFGDPGAFSARFPRPVRTGTAEHTGGGSFGWAPGEFTDDTQMGLILARRLVEDAGYDPDRLWVDWRAWASTAADVGTTTRAALAATHWREARHARVEWTAANGALMRAFPLGVALLDVDDALARRVVLHQAALTHPHVDAGLGAWLAVAMVRAALIGADPFTVLDREVMALPDASRVRFAPLLASDWRPSAPHPGNGSVWGCLAEAVWAVRVHPDVESALPAAIDLGGDADTVACVAGAIVGAIHGIQGVPARWATPVHGRVTVRADDATGTDAAATTTELRHDLESVQRLALRLLGTVERPVLAEEPAHGPTEVAPGLCAANLAGASTVPEDWAVVSLCRTDGRFSGHAHRTQVHLIDRPGGHNGGLASAVADAVDAIDAHLAEGRPVVVHCHGGRSRTGLVLKAWWMRRQGGDERGAHAWLTERWGLYADYEPSFVEFLQGDWVASSR